MPDLFNYNFPVISNSQNNTSGGGTSSADNNSGLNVPRSPVSYIFTELDKIETQKIEEAFGPVGTTTTPPEGTTPQITYSEKKFNLTNVFTAKTNENPQAFAVTDGILFIVPQKENSDFVNLFLRPTNPVDIGIKIKYYVYRSVKKENFFKANGSSFDLLQKGDTNLLPLLNKVWDDFLEYNDIPTENTSTVIFEAKQLGFSPDILKSNQAFFTKDQYTLPRVKIGDHIGNFGAQFGFEVVVDEGDFVQDNSDTGFELEEAYFTARKCVLNLDKNNDSVDYGNLPNTVSEIVFRESVYLFLDSAAYYGLHVTKNNDSNEGTIIIKNEIKHTKPSDIYKIILKSFFNKNKIYLYIKSRRGRSYNFYDNKDKPLNGNSEIFNYSLWPIKVFEKKFNISLSFDIRYLGCMLYCNAGLSEGRLYGSDALLVGNDPSFGSSIIFNIPNTGQDIISSLIYLTYQDGKNENDHLFGSANLKSIFEQQDFKGEKGSYVNHLRSVMIKDGNDIGLYKTKIILHGDYISSNNPPEMTDEQLAEILPKNLRTYILFPQRTTRDRKDQKRHIPTAGYYTSFEDVVKYCNTIYGEGEIWRGVIKENIDIDSLLYRRKDNDEDFPIYQLGMSQKDYLSLEKNATTLDINATNFFFNIEEDSGSNSSAYIKYKMKMEFDKKDGKTRLTTNFISLYTVDGYFFFTEDYSTAFKYGKSFANIAVDFIPHNLASYNNGYECGFDYFWHDYHTSPFDGGRLYENLLGKYYNNATGNLENLDVKNLNNYTFKVNRKTFFNLIALKYNSKPTQWRFTNGDSALHADSYLTLYPKPHPLAKEVTVKLKFSKSKNPTQLYIKYNKKFIAINDPTAVATENDEYGKHLIPSDKYKNPITSTNNNYSIKIMALRECTEDIPIEVIAVEGEDKKLAGKCWIRKNSERYTIDIVLVNCKTNLNGTEKEGLPSSNVAKVKEILQNFLRQILIDPKFDLADVDLTTTDFKTNYAPNGNINSSENMFTFVKNLLTSGQQKQMVLLFFNESATNPTLAGQASIVNGYMGGAFGARIFALGITDNTIAHEALHSIGLHHSFDNDGDYTFKYKDTDNIMDYSSTQNLIWYWQDFKVKKTSNNSKLLKEI